MIATLRRGTGLLATALALSLLPIPGSAQESEKERVREVTSTVHAWKLGYARRMAEERLERRQIAAERERRLRRLAKRTRLGEGARSSGRGQHLRPARPNDPSLFGTALGSARVVTRPSGARAITPPANIIVNDRAGDGASSGQRETSIVAFGNRMLAAWNDGEGFSSDSQGWATSTDGGLTWVDQGAPPHPPGVSNFQWFSDPVLTVNEKTGAFYFSALCLSGSGTSARNGIAIGKGRFNGSTFVWDRVAIARDLPNSSNDALDKQWIVADSASSRVFLSYTTFSNEFGSQVEFQRADSALTAFSSPLRMSLNTDTENGWVHGSRPVVDGDGNVYVMYYLIGQQEADFYRIRRSNDSGASFTSPVTAASLYTNFGTGAPGFNRALGVQFAGISVDRSHGPERGRLYLSWAESLNWLDDLATAGQAGARSEVEPNDMVVDATPAAVGQTLRGSLTASDVVDVYKLPLAAGESFLAAADSIAAGTECSLILLAGDGSTRLTFTTMNASNLPAGWMFTAPTAGTYYLVVRLRFGSGGYRLRLGPVDRAGERGRDQRDVFVSSSMDGTAWTTPVRLTESPVGFDDWLPEVAVAPDGGVYSAWYDWSQASPASNGGESSIVLARSGDAGITWTTLGTVSDTLSRWSASSTNIEPNQGDYMSLFANDSYVWPCWADARRGNPDTFVGRVPLIPNGAQVAFEAVRLAPRAVSIDWRVTPADTLTMRLYRSTDGGAFSYHDLVAFDGLGQASYTDTLVVADHGYSYRLGRFVNGIEIFFGQVSVFLPSSFPLSLAAPRPNPVTGNTYGVSFSLATDEPAELILHDISGREVFRRTLNLGRGPHTLSLPVTSGVRQGLYVLTLRQGGRNTSTRFNLVR